MNEFFVVLWKTLRSNPVFVAFSASAAGAAVSFIQDEFERGRLDFSTQGLHKLGGYAFAAGVAAVVHLYRPSPGTNPNTK